MNRIIISYQKLLSKKLNNGCTDFLVTNSKSKLIVILIRMSSIKLIGQAQFNDKRYPLLKALRTDLGTDPDLEKQLLFLSIIRLTKLSTHEMYFFSAAI